MRLVFWLLIVIKEVVTWIYHFNPICIIANGRSTTIKNLGKCKPLEGIFRILVFVDEPRHWKSYDLSIGEV